MCIATEKEEPSTIPKSMNQGIEKILEVTIQEISEMRNNKFLRDDEMESKLPQIIKAVLKNDDLI